MEEFKYTQNDDVSALLGLASTKDEAETMFIESTESSESNAKAPSSLSPRQLVNLQVDIPNEQEMPIDIISPSSLVLVPSLRGYLQFNGPNLVCKGLWAISDDQHNQPGQTSDFEFKLTKALSEPGIYPISGKYSGYFMLKQPPPTKSLKIEEREILLKFVASGEDEEEGSYSVEGHGSNRFGNFSLRGSLNADKYIVLYKDYISSASHQKRPSTSSVNTPSSKPKKPVVETPVSTPREGSGRIRKPSTSLLGFEDPVPFRRHSSGDKDLPADSTGSTVATSVSSKSASVTNKTGASTSSKSASATSKTVASKPIMATKEPQQASTSKSSSSDSSRAQRLPSHLVKCNSLLQEIMKHPQAMWFLEPVDYIKLGIPEYPTIVKQPMDFRSIKENIDNSVYDTPEQFGEHVRLVFKNAMTFNSQKDHPVHVAAKELAYKFEERFRQLIAQFLAAANTPAGALAAIGASITDYEAPRPTPRPSSSSGGGEGPTGPRPPSSSSSPRPPANRVSFGGGAGGEIKRGPGKPPRGAAPAPPQWKGQKPAAGPRTMEAFLPPAVDVNSAHLIEMQKKMQEMQEEILALRTAMRQSEIKTNLETQRDAARNPLSFEEKKELIAQINNLPPEKMDQVIQIIQAAMPKRDDGSDEMEVPLDDLDTLTLRKLQTYVESCIGKKRRPKSASSGGKEGAPKRHRPSGSGDSKSPRPAKSASSASSGGSVGGGEMHMSSEDSIGAFRPHIPDDEEEHMLFSPDALEEIEVDEQSLMTSSAEPIEF